MIKFTGGPAEGEFLALRRAPLYLRVVRCPCGEFDALDQTRDGPKANEQVFVYRRTGRAAHMHLCFGGKRKAASGWYAVAEYAFVEDQPPESVVRDRAAWRAWATAAYESGRKGAGGGEGDAATKQAERGGVAAADAERGQGGPGGGGAAGG